MNFNEISEPIHWLGNLDDLFEFFYDEDGNAIDHDQEIIGRAIQLDQKIRRI
jgi:hypothetical protein